MGFRVVSLCRRRKYLFRLFHTIYHYCRNNSTMGNSESTPSPPPVAPVESTFPPKNDFSWPENLYVETRDMGALSFLVYTWSYVLDTLGDSIPKKDRFTIQDVIKIIDDNKKVLQEGKHGSDFADDSKTYESLQLLKDRPEGELSLEDFDDDYQTKELVYGVGKDDFNKRITVVFRGTTNSLAFRSNWGTNLDVAKKSEPIPEVLKGKISGTKIRFHEGFHEYMNNKTKNPNDDSETTKKDQIFSSVKALLKKHPDYKVYVTGHSLGAALATMASYYLSIDEEIPKPVTCINFASPRVGDSRFLKAVRVLEKEGNLRHLRVVNENDTVTVAPTVGFNHVGFMMKMHEAARKDIEISYPKENESWGSWFGRAWDMSIPASLNVTYDHGEYRERVETQKDEIEKLDLNKMYSDPNLTGFE